MPAITRLLCLASGFLLVAPPLAAQAPERPAPRWAVLLATGVATGRSSKDVEANMRSAGYADVRPELCFFIFCSPRTQYPESYPEGGTALLSVRRQVGARTHLGAMISSTGLGTTAGYRHDTAGMFPPPVLYLKQDVVAAGVFGGISGPGGIWASAGPALYRVSLGDEGAAETRDRDATDRIGGVALAGVPVPLPFAFFLEVQGQYRFTGSAELGPIRHQSSSGAQDRTYPRGRVNFNHGVVLVGAGRRF